MTLSFVACKDEENPIVPPPQTIGSTVISNRQLGLLEAAVRRAGLTATLNGTGPFTVFAPSDAAFQAAGFADTAAINRAPVATLQQILSYHVISGSALSSTAITTGQTAVPTSLSSAAVYVSRATSTSGTSSSVGTGISVNNARVIRADQQATNGIVHIIDRVLLPPAGNVLQLVAADPDLSLLVTAATLGGTAVTGALSGNTPLTVFAPTNAAFNAAGYRTAADIQAAPVAALTAILTNHVVAPARAYSPTIVNGPVTTFGGGSVTATVGANDAITLLSRGNGTNAANVLQNTVTNGALVQNRDINATNGVIHKIDRVLLP
ncbi:fasciclin domain-containing protein [Spirosoma soli]